MRKKMERFFGTNSPKKEFWGLNFKNVSLHPEPVPPEPVPLRYHMWQCLGKTDNFEFFSLNLGRCFGSKNVEGAAVRWVEVDGGRWS